LELDAMMSHRRKIVQRRLRFLACVPLLLCASAGAASAAASDESPPKNTRWVETSARNIELGKSTFGLCMGCHGEDGAGRIGIGPRIASKTYLAAASDDFLAETIKKGRSPTTMIPWENILSDQQVEAVIAYLRSREPVEPAVLDESELKGVAESGEQIFRAVCSGCHGRSGAGYQETANGTGIGRKAFLDSASNGFLRYIVSYGKSQTKMRGFASKNVTAVANLSAQEIEDTIAYLRANAW
jgi:cytochrome c oxidase cbb3-type subunit 3